jgi:hypothetical protein
MSESDAKIQEGLWEQMKDHPQLDTTHIVLEVHSGNVLLKGRADTQEEKELAGQMAKDYPGVVSVKNELHLDLGIIHAITSLVSGIAKSNEEELHHHPETEEEKKKKSDEEKENPKD